MIGFVAVSPEYPNPHLMSHQELIAKAVAGILALEPNVVAAFCRNNPMSMLLRSYDEHSADGKPLYKKESGRKHYKMSVAAYESAKHVKELYGEHLIPLSQIRKLLLSSGRKFETVLSILRSNEVILLTKEEASYLDKPVAKGGMGLKMTMPENGLCRLKAAGIQIHPNTLNNKL